MMRGTLSILAGLLLLPSMACAQATLVDGRLKAQLVADNLGFGIGSLSSAFAFVDRDTVLVASRVDGKIRRVDLVVGAAAGPGAVVVDLDIVANTPSDSESEFGVQGITLAPDFAQSGRVYLRYDKSLAPGGDTPEASLPSGYTVTNAVERWVWDAAANGGSGALTFEATVYTIPITRKYHHGGAAAFLLDGTLLVPVGDQRITTGPSVNLPAGPPGDYAVILRLNADGTIPADNPFNNVACPEYARAWYAYGVRNIYGLAVDPAAGHPWYTDNGEFLFDELCRGFAGLNSGHRLINGPTWHPAQTGTTTGLHVLPGSQYAEPAFAWRYTVGITGVAFLHHSALGPAWDDLLVAGMFNFGYLWGFRLDGPRTGFNLNHPGLADRVDDRAGYSVNPVGTEAEELLFGRSFGGNFVSTVALTTGPDGLLYTLNAQGRIWRITRSCWADIATAGGDYLSGPDGFLTGDDFDAFVAGFFGAITRPGGHLIADVATAGPGAPGEPDGFLTGDDFDRFVFAFFAGCP